MCPGLLANKIWEFSSWQSRGRALRPILQRAHVPPGCWFCGNAVSPGMAFQPIERAAGDPRYSVPARIGTRDAHAGSAVPAYVRDRHVAEPQSQLCEGELQCSSRHAIGAGRLPKGRRADRSFRLRGRGALGCAGTWSQISPSALGRLGRGGVALFCSARPVASLFSSLPGSSRFHRYSLSCMAQRKRSAPNRRGHLGHVCHRPAKFGILFLSPGRKEEYD